MFREVVIVYAEIVCTGCGKSHNQEAIKNHKFCCYEGPIELCYWDEHDNVYTETELRAMLADPANHSVIREDLGQTESRSDSQNNLIAFGTGEL